MQEKTNDLLKATPEQILYARILEKGMYLGLLCIWHYGSIYSVG